MKMFSLIEYAQVAFAADVPEDLATTLLTREELDSKLRELAISPQSALGRHALGGGRLFDRKGSCYQLTSSAHVPARSPHASTESTSDVAEDVLLDRCRVCLDVIAAGESLARDDRGVVVACHATCAGLTTGAAQALRRGVAAATQSEAVPGLRMLVRYSAAPTSAPATAQSQQSATPKREATVDDFADAFIAQSGGAASHLVDAAADAFAGAEPLDAA